MGDENPSQGSRDRSKAMDDVSGLIAHLSLMLNSLDPGYAVRIEIVPRENRHDWTVDSLREHLEALLD